MTATDASGSSSAARLAPSPSRARVSRPPAATTGHSGHPDGWRAFRVPEAERVRLAAELGALLRSERLAAGWSLGRLARAVPCHRSTLCHLQAGTRRPSRGLLAAIASVLAVDDPAPLRMRLIEAAGESLRPDSDGVLHRRIRAAQAAILRGDRPLTTDLARRVDLHRRASAARQAADALLWRPGALDDPGALDEVNRLMAEARRLRELAGTPFTLRLGRHELRFGLEW